MKKNFQLALIMSSLVFFSACSPDLRPFTQQLLQQGGWTDSELQKIQFYLSEDVVLQRAATEGSSTIVGGTIKIVQGKRMEEVRFKRGTPGVFVQRKGSDHFAVSFDAVNVQHTLNFGPNPKRRGAYVLLASNWQRSGVGEVHYNNGTYFTNPDATLAALLVDLRKINRLEVESKVVKGRRVE